MADPVAAGTQKPKKIVLDLDTGIDDALALAFALSRPDAELVAVTCTFGNIYVDDAVRNTRALLALLGRPGIPVYRGAESARPGTPYERTRGSVVFHGENGLGGVELAEPAVAAEEKDAAEFLVEAARRWGEELTIVPTGPLTNIARAVERDRAAMAGVGRIVLMGGALAVPGNVSPFAEANISNDPEAADAVFSCGAEVVMVGLDVTLRATLSRADVAGWPALGPRGQAYAQILEHYFRATETVSPGAAGCALHDPLALAVALDPSYVTLVPLPVTVRCDEAQRGRTVLDQSPSASERAARNLVALDVDAPRFVADLLRSLAQLFSAEAPGAQG